MSSLGIQTFGVIKSFDEVPTTQGLVSLDIDETVLYFPSLPSDYWDVTINKHIENGASQDEARSLALDYYSNHINQNIPTPTDLDGLHRLIKRSPHCIFLTARPESDNHHTRRHLDHLGVPQTIPIYNSNGFHRGNKGIILRNIAEEFEEVIAVDDTEKHLNDIREAFQNSPIKCYLYKFVHQR